MVDRQGPQAALCPLIPPQFFIASSFTSSAHPRFASTDRSPFLPFQHSSQPAN